MSFRAVAPRVALLVMLAIVGLGNVRGDEGASRSIGRQLSFKGWVDGRVPEEIVFQSKSPTRLDGQQLVVNTRVIDENLGEPPSGIERPVRRFFELREAARAIVADLPPNAFSVTTQVADEARQCAAFNLAGALFAEELLRPDDPHLGNDQLDALITKAHTHIAEHVLFAIRPLEEPKVEPDESPMAQAVGIKPLSESVRYPLYNMTVMYGNNAVIAMASLTATLGWVSGRAGASASAIGIRARRPVLAALEDRQYLTESFWSWSLRQCRQLTFIDRRPLAFLLVELTGKESPEQQVKAGNPMVLSIKNVGARSIEGRQTILLFSETPEAEEPDYRLEDAQTFSIKVPPLGRQFVDLRLRYTAQPGRTLALVADPDGDTAPLAASFAGPKIRIPTCSDRLQDRSTRVRAGSLAHAVLTYAAAAESEFESLIEKKREHGFVDEKPRLAIPGAISNHLLRMPWATLISASMYVGDSKVNGRKAFDAAVAAIRDVCGSDAGELNIQTDGPVQFASFTIRTLSAEASFELAFSDNIVDHDQGKYKVDLTITSLSSGPE